MNEKNHTVSIRVSAEEKAELKGQALLAGMTLSDYVRERASGDLHAALNHGLSQLHALMVQELERADERRQAQNEKLIRSLAELLEFRE